MKQINFKNDVRISYDAKSKTVEVRWTDWEAAARGLKGNSRTKKRKIKVDEYTRRAEAEERLKIIAEKEQKDSIQRAQYLLGRVESGDVAPDSIKVPFATKFLRNLKDSQVTSSEREKTIRDARKAVNDFSDWLDKNYPNILLNKITKVIAEAYFKTLEKKFAFSSIKTTRAYLVFTFNRIIDYFEEAPFKILNPFSRVTLKKVLTDTVENRKAIFSKEELSLILKRAGQGERLKTPMLVQRYALFYFLMVTGWRVGDIADMTWEAVNYKKRILTNLHAKTEKSTGVSTKIYITPLMERVLKTMESYQRPEEFKKYIFSVGRKGVKDLHQRIVTNTQSHMDNMREELNLHDSAKRGKYEMHSHTIHSIRGSFITHMVGEGHPETLVDYIVGHNLSSVNAKHYSRYDSDPEKFTRTIIETMEGFIDAEFAFHVSIYGEDRAMGLMIDGDSIEAMPNGWEENLIKNKFWTEEGIDYLRYLSDVGNPPSKIKKTIEAINRYREEKAAKLIDASLIEKYTGRPFKGIPK